MKRTQTSDWPTRSISLGGIPSGGLAVGLRFEDVDVRCSSVAVLGFQGRMALALHFLASWPKPIDYQKCENE